MGAKNLTGPINDYDALMKRNEIEQLLKHFITGDEADDILHTTIGK